MRIAIIILLILASSASVFALRTSKCQRYKGHLIRCSEGYYNRVKVLDGITSPYQPSADARHFSLSFGFRGKIRKDDLNSFLHYFKKYVIYTRARRPRAIGVQYEYYKNYRRMGTYHFGYNNRHDYSLQKAVWYNYKGLRQVTQHYSKTRNRYTVKNEYFNDFGILVKVNQNTYDRKTNRLLQRASRANFYSQDFILGEQEY